MAPATAEYTIPTRGITMIVLISVLLLLAIMAVVARFYARHISKEKLAADDYLIVVGLLSTIAAIVCCDLSALNGIGDHTKNVSKVQMTAILKLFVAGPILWALATTSVKLSILCWYLTIFCVQTFHKAAYALIALSIAQLLVVALQMFLLCRPFEYTWNKEIDGHCGSSLQGFLSVAIINMVIDLSIVLLPMPILWGLKMHYRKKIAIAFVLCIGLWICAISAARIKFVFDIVPNDFTYSIVNDLIFGSLEIELGIICACLPILPPLFRSLLAARGNLTSGCSNSDSKSTEQKQVWSDRESKTERFQRLGEAIYSLDDIRIST